MSRCQNLKLLSYEMTNRLVWACHSALYVFFCFLGKEFLFPPEETIICSAEKKDTIGRVML